MKKTFNLSSQRKKMVQAYYNGAQGVMKGMTRAWMNCYKAKCDSGMEPSAAWESCKEEYQNSLGNSDWRTDYS